MNELVGLAVGAIYEVQNVVGPGFLEKVYEKALVKELQLRGLHVQAQAPLRITYKGASAGTYYADLLIEGMLVIELKCVDQFCDEHVAQYLNYLKAAGLHLALLVNFQHPRVEWKRIVYDF